MKFPNILTTINWLILVCCVNTKNIILKDEYNATSVSSKWNSSGVCSDPWSWSKIFKRWRTCTYTSDEKGPCYLESFYWTTAKANMVYVDLSIAMMSCQEVSCRESINVYWANEINNRYEFITKAPTTESRYDWSTTTYTHTFKISSVGNRVKLKFESKSFCGFISNILVYYKECDKVAAGLATFPVVTAPNNTDALTVTGKCVPNARHESERNPSLICFGNGTSKIDSGCTCTKGFRQVNQTCVVDYKQCDQVTTGLAAFPAATASNNTDPLTVTGKCVMNAKHEYEQTPSLICFRNGTSEIESACTCLKGFRQVNQTCVFAKDSPSPPLKNIIIGLAIGIGAVIVVAMMAIYYRFKTKPGPNRAVRCSLSNVQTTLPDEFNNNMIVHAQPNQTKPTKVHIYESICQTSTVHVYSNINNQSGTQYDVFICYSSMDREWVKDTLLKELESRGIKACIDFRDFLVGAYIFENIVEAIYGSRKTIAVISPDFLDSVYCKHELKTALSRMAHHQVIPILYRTCDVPQSLKDKTYLDWRHDDVKPYFWEHLVKAIDNTSHPIV